ncbi:GTP pyrophosphokinase family protein [Savagea sp. SN6]|uniref:GTP diphosphokinase n=1 Tax=Savagea serpentis TaxID=2785297 RepID=A0A8J7KCZ1_9BACL|nr:GTP pyrophosphokinase family protein [Savagea serpentis]MBF4502027.1 GTP pyrophosphokinase family protein [Savagea serpentis]
MDHQWDQFLAPYVQAVDELKVKLKAMRSHYRMEDGHVPIEFVTGRVKPLISIYDKTLEKNVPFQPGLALASHVPDIAGLRIMCQFVDDVETVVHVLRARKDFCVVEERDYVTNKKESGYRSYHMIVEYPVQTLRGEKKIFVEIQIRTLAMNFWASIEHTLNYKYEGNLPEAIQKRLENAAEAAFRLDEEMSAIRDEINEAQHYFKTYKELSNRRPKRKK